MFIKHVFTLSIMPQIEEKYEDIPRFGELNVGTALSIIKVEKVKTEKNGYDAAILTLKGGDRLFALEGGVMYQLGQVKGEITAKDPLNVVVSEYKDNFGEMRKSIKNA